MPKKCVDLGQQQFGVGWLFEHDLNPGHGGRVGHLLRQAGGRQNRRRPSAPPKQFSAQQQAIHAMNAIADPSQDALRIDFKQTSEKWNDREADQTRNGRQLRR